MNVFRAITLFFALVILGHTAAAQTTLVWDPPTDQTVSPDAYRCYDNGTLLGQTPSTQYPVTLGSAAHTFGVSAIHLNPDGTFSESPQATINVQAPSCTIGVDAQAVAGVPVGTAVTIYLGSTAGSAPIVSWVVTFGDGAFTSGVGMPPATLTHVFPVGSFGVWLDVTDSNGLKGHDGGGPVNVIGSAPPPLTITCPSVAPVASPNGGPVVVNYPMALLSGGTQPYALTYSPSGTTFAVGSTTVNAFGTDSGNPSQSTSCGFTVMVTWTPPPAGDTLAPTITEFTVSRRNGGQFAIHVRATDNVGVARIDIRVNSTIRKTCRATTVCDLNTKTLVPGTNTVAVQARDAAGNSTLLSQQVTR